MKKLFLILLPILLTACNRPSQPSTGNQKFWSLHFSQAHGVAYGSLPDQQMDIYSQGTWIGEQQYWQSDTVLHPTLVYIHGGGWLGGTRNQITPFIIPYLEKGYNVVTLDYRTGPGTAPQAIDDCMMALQWISRHAGDYNINRQQVVVSGESAGGHLALISGMLNSINGSHRYYCGDSLKVQAIVNWFGISDIAGVNTFYCAKGETKNYVSIWIDDSTRIDSISNAFSPLRRIEPGIPPIISIHGKKDSVVPFAQSDAFHQSLSQQGLRNELVAFDNGKHLGFTADEFDEAFSRIFNFIQLQKQNPIAAH